MNLKAFFVAALQQALDLGIAVPDDVIRHVTPDVLSIHLPRPLWARLLTACLGAPRVDAQLVVETVGVPNLCEHVPAQIIWGCIQEIAERSLGGAVAVPVVASRGSQPSIAAAAARPAPLATPPPPPVEHKPAAAAAPPVAQGPSIPPPAPTFDEREDTGRSRIPVSQRFRQSNTGIGRLAATSNARRPQAQATPPTPPPAAEPPDRVGSSPRVKRGQTEADYDLETVVGGKDDWKNVLAVEDEQLVDWSATDETVTTGEELGRKR